MKVLFLIDSLEPYGAEKSLVDLIVRFKRIEPVIVSIKSGGSLKSVLNNHNIKIYFLENSEKSGYSEMLERMMEIVGDENPEVLHATLYRSEMLARKVKAHTPNIILVGSLVSNSYSRRRYGQLNFISKIKLFKTQLLDRFSSGEVDYFISNSSAIIESNSKSLQIPIEKIKVIPRGRELAKNREKAALPILMESDSKIFLSVGRLTKNKGFIDLINAFAEIVKRNNAILLIAGDGNYSEEISKRITVLNLQEKVFLLGYRNDVFELMQRADFFVFASYFEGLPGALIEAILSRTPSIVSNIPENLECFPANGGCLSFEVGNVKSLEQKLIEALKIDEAEWKKKTEKSFKYALENFEIEKVVDKYEKFYFHISGN